MGWLVHLFGRSRDKRFPWRQWLSRSDANVARFAQAQAKLAKRDPTTAPSSAANPYIILSDDDDSDVEIVGPNAKKARYTKGLQPQPLNPLVTLSPLLVLPLVPPLLLLAPLAHLVL